MKVNYSNKTHLGNVILALHALATFVAQWAARHIYWAAYLIVALSWLPMVTSLETYNKQGDIELYESDADALVQGRMPYRDILFEYPPYSILIFLLPRVFGRDNYFDGFRMLAVLCDLLIRGGLFWAGLRYAQGLRSLLPLISYCVAVPFLRFFLLQRFDLWPALICLVALFLFVADKPRWSGFAIALGIGVKVYPAIFVPPLLVLAFGQGRARRFSAGFIAGLSPILLLTFSLPCVAFCPIPGWPRPAMRISRGIVDLGRQASRIDRRSLGILKAMDGGARFNGVRSVALGTGIVHHHSSCLGNNCLFGRHSTFGA